MPVSQRLPRDTGVRNISASLVGFTGTIQLRRVGWTCTVLLEGVTRAATSPVTGAVLIANAPAGFKPQAGWWDYRPQAYNPGTGAAATFPCWAAATAVNGTWLSVGATPANWATYAAFLYTTTEAWPATLPGTPV